MNGYEASNLTVVAMRIDGRKTAELLRDAFLKTRALPFSGTAYRILSTARCSTS